MSSTAAPEHDQTAAADIGRWFDQVFATVDAGTPARGERIAGVHRLVVAAAAAPEVDAVLGALCGGMPEDVEPSPPLDVAVVGPDILTSPLPSGLLPAPGETHRVLVRDGGRWAYGGGDGVAWLLDADRRRAVRWAGPDGPPDWERCSPLRHIVSWWAGVHGGALVHAAAVATDAGAALLVGPSGSGKSTTALACLDSSLRVLGDDYCVLTPGPGGGWSVAPLYRQAKVDHRSLALVPGLRERRTGAVVVGKEVVVVDPPTGAAGVIPVVAVCATSVAADGVTRATPASRAAVLRRLAPSTLGQSAGAEQPTWYALTDLIRRAATFDLGVGADPTAAAPVLAEVIERAAASTR